MRSAPALGLRRDQHRPRRLAALVALAVALASLGSLGNPAQAAAWDTAAADARSEDALIDLTNATRAGAGLPRLSLDPRLVELARWRSEDMAERDYFSHEIPPAGSMVFDSMDEQGYCFDLAGENIGWAGGGDDGAEERIQTMFVESPTHLANILGAPWDAIGVGSYKRADGRKFWTVLFADRCAADASDAADAGNGTPPPRPR